MSFTTDTEIVALMLIIVVHVIGAGVLIWGMIDQESSGGGGWRDWWPRDDPDDDGPPPDPVPRPTGGTALGVPVLPTSTPSPGRVREGGRIGDRTPRPARRPAHPPTPTPTPTPAPARPPAHDDG